MPKRANKAPVRPAPIQLPLFAETASLVRVRPALNEWRYYRMEIWPDLFGRALLVRHWGRIGTQGHRRLHDHPPVRHPPRQAPPGLPGPRLVKPPARIARPVQKAARTPRVAAGKPAGP